MEIIDSNSTALEKLKETYPNAVSVPMAVWNISHVFYENNSYQKQIAETQYYAKNLLGKWDVFGKLKLIMYV